MRYGKKRSFEGPYETLSDIAIGSLGVFVILVVVIVIISTLHSTGVSNVFEKIKNENDYYESEIIRAKNASEDYKSNDFAKKEIRQLRRGYDKTKRKLDRTRERLDLEKERLQSSKNKFEEVTSVLDVIDQKKKEHADFVVETEKLNIQLKSLIDRQTGYGVDRTGRPKMEYGLCWDPDESRYYGEDYKEGIKNAYFKIGNSSFTIEQFDGFLRSIGHEGEVGFFISHKSYNYSNCYSSKPDWLEKWFNERNWSKADAKVKEGY
ncbi:MAG: hypothetical protein H8E98_08540 [Bacteroidetes bacterium]|nr:hypothetical protein [Bacteroidota bacterium]